MTLRAKFALIVALSLIAVMVAGALLVRQLQAAAIQREMRNRGELLVQFGKACRAYTKEEMGPAVKKVATDTVLEAEVPARVLVGVMNRLTQKLAGDDMHYTYRQATFNPTNPDNAPTQEEQKIINELRRMHEGGQEAKLSGHAVLNKQDVYYQAEPIIVEQSCLRCHGDPADAPAVQLAQYGRKNGFGWKVGSVQGALIVAAPRADLLAAQGKLSGAIYGIFLAIGLVTVGMIYLFFDRLVNRRVTNALAVMDQFVVRPTSERRIQDTSQDELGKLGQAFNRTADSLRDSFVSLEERIAERTEQLRSALAEAESATKSKSDFLATMSHEIRTPMNGVIGMLDLLKTTELDQEQQEFANMAQQSARSLLTVINDILDYSKIEAGKLDMEELPFDVRLLVEDTTKLFSLRAEEKGLELVCLVRPDIPVHLHGDPSRIRQILNNYLSNALKFTQRGEVMVDLELLAATPDDVTLKFSVRDTGIGIPPDRMNRLFKAFSQVDASTTRQFGGTGLGLVICQRLANMMGGEVGAESRVGLGSTFWFTARLPRQIDKGKDLNIPAKLRGMRVLVVDDSYSTRRVEREALKAWNCFPTEAESGSDAFAKLTDAAREMRPFALALVDSEMPGMNGAQLADMVKKDPLLRDIDLILVTTFSQRIEPDELRRLGFAASIPKPVTYSGIFDAIMTILGDGTVVQKADWRQEIAHPAAAAAGVHILLAEDNPVNQKVAVNLLQRAGYDVDVAGNGQLAVDKMREGAYDVILMDMEMPVMDGITATKEIRQLLGEAGKVPIIAMTANVMQSDRESCLAAGMNDFVTKPIEPQLLFDTLRKHVTKLQRAAEEAEAAAARAAPDVSPPPAEPSHAVSSPAVSIDPERPLQSSQPYQGHDPLAPKPSADPLAPLTSPASADPLATFAAPPTIATEPSLPVPPPASEPQPAETFKLSHDPLGPPPPPAPPPAPVDPPAAVQEGEAQVRSRLAEPAEPFRRDPLGPASAATPERDDFDDFMRPGPREHDGEVAPIDIPLEVEHLAKTADPLAGPAPTPAPSPPSPQLADRLVRPTPAPTGPPASQWDAPAQGLSVGPGQLERDPMERRFYEEPASSAVRPTHDRGQVVDKTRAQLENMFGKKPPLDPFNIPRRQSPVERFAAPEPEAEPEPPPRQFAPVPQESILDQLGYEAPRFEPAAEPAATPVTVEQAPAPIAEPEPQRRDLGEIFGAVEEATRPTPAPAPSAATGISADFQPALPKTPIDISASIDRIGDATFWVDLMQTYIAEVDQRLAGAAEGLRQGAPEHLRHEAHTIKGSSAEMAIPGMRDLALQLERLAQAGDLDAAAPVLASLRGEFIRLKMYLASQRPEFNV